MPTRSPKSPPAAAPASPRTAAAKRPSTRPSTRVEAAAKPPAHAAMASAARATLTLSSKNYGSWSMRGWLLCRMAGLDFAERVLGTDDAATRAELLLLSPSFLVPALEHEGVKVWDVLAIAEYLDERFPQAGLLPTDIATRAHVRAVSGEMHQGFANLRSALPFHVKGRYPGFKVFAGALADIERVCTIWRDCLAQYGGPYLFGAAPTLADAMYAPVVLRFHTYDVTLDAVCKRYADTVRAWPLVREYVAAAQLEPDDMEELDAEF